MLHLEIGVEDLDLEGRAERGCLRRQTEPAPAGDVEALAAKRRDRQRLGAIGEGCERQVGPATAARGVLEGDVRSVRAAGDASGPAIDATPSPLESSLRSGTSDDAERDERTDRR